MLGELATKIKQGNSSSSHVNPGFRCSSSSQLRRLAGRRLDAVDRNGGRLEERASERGLGGLQTGRLAECRLAGLDATGTEEEGRSWAACGCGLGGLPQEPRRRRETKEPPPQPTGTEKAT